MVKERDPGTDLTMRGAQAVYSACVEVRRAFDDITSRARGRFERRDWRGMQADAVERLEVTPRLVALAVEQLGSLMGRRRADPAFWRAIHGAYAALLKEDPDPQLAQTFFNSVSRRLLGTVGLAEDIDFFTSAPDPEGGDPDRDMLHRYPWNGDVAALLDRMLADLDLAATFRDREGDIKRVAALMSKHLSAQGGPPPLAVEMLRPLFVRNKGAYMVGRFCLPTGYRPLVLPLVHPPAGVGLDTALLDEDLVSIVFSFARSYFHVASERHGELIRFLRSILPLKPVTELYIAIGHNKHGKTEMYRSLRRHMDNSDDAFVTAAGSRGMVMLVFTLPSYDIVFKIIRDRFDRPKTSTRNLVMERYRLVFKHDRVGRLVDAQEFTRLRLPRRRFGRELLVDLLQNAARTVHLEGDDVVIDHVYLERRMIPLNIFVRREEEAAARAAVVDYGNAIRELAAANIFPGDFLLKNFGVTRHGRVVFYDYDELCLVTDCRFRRMPPPRCPEEELDPEPWFAVKENDIFPEEFRRFIGLPADLANLFERHHSDLFTVAFWRDQQERHRRGELMDFFPYPRDTASASWG
ncbi:MAG: bifunctional isocitrate dehydrogenase kinase/phosphatase [Acidobacteria bacterium]|nr:bifunctional isocitrate dehydrogenase kinase/phosphatase [Acidobacteriota bacterium]